MRHVVYSMAIEYVQPLLKALDLGHSRFTYGIERTPDDRLNWSPGGATKTPLQLAGKLAAFYGFFTLGLRGEARGRDLPEPPTSREEAITRLNSAFEVFRTTIEGLTEADLEQRRTPPWGESSVREMLWWLQGALMYHQGQLNYVQLAYGDEDPNMPTEWRKG